MNSISISGRLTKDPELRRTQSGTAVCSFSVAVDRPGVKDKTDFIDCVAWDKRAEFVSKYFLKGDPIEVNGVLTRRWRSTATVSPSRSRRSRGATASRRPARARASRSLKATTARCRSNQNEGSV